MSKKNKRKNKMRERERLRDAEGFPTKVVESIYWRLVFRTVQVVCGIACHYNNKKESQVAPVEQV